MPVASKIASALTLCMLALSITPALALPMTPEMGQAAEVVRRDHDSRTLVSRATPAGGGDATNPRKGYGPETKESEKEEDARRELEKLMARLRESEDPVLQAAGEGKTKGDGSITRGQKT